MKFENLVFKKHAVLGETKEDAREIIEIVPDFEGSKQAIFNDKKINVSIFIGKMFYSNGVDTYEVMSITDEEPTGYLSKQEVEDHINNLIKKEKRWN